MANTQRPQDELQILPLALPAEYVDRASASPRSGASSAFRLECGLDASDLYEHGASAEVRSPAGARAARPCGRAAPVVLGAADECQAEPTRRSQRAVKKRAWADDSDEEGGGKPVMPGLSPSVLHLLPTLTVLSEIVTAAVIAIVRPLVAESPENLAVRVDSVSSDDIHSLLHDLRRQPERVLCQ